MAAHWVRRRREPRQQLTPTFARSGSRRGGCTSRRPSSRVGLSSKEDHLLEMLPGFVVHSILADQIADIVSGKIIS